MAQEEVRKKGRNKALDLLRIVFAATVILAHAPELTDGTDRRELAHRFLHLNVNVGSFAVDGFFLLSGYLIVQSWTRTPQLLPYMRSRLLRIVPGYLVAVILSIVVLGLLVPSHQHYFREYWNVAPHNLRSIARLGVPLAPEVFPTLPIHALNLSLWTISYEFRCYLAVAILGLFGVFRKRRVWVGLTCVLLLVELTPWLAGILSWKGGWDYLGEPSETFRLLLMFFVGGCFFLARGSIRFRPVYACIAGLLLLLCPLYGRGLQPAVAIFGGYLIFYLGQADIPLPEWINRVPDISYGLYLYGWPVEGLWIAVFHGSPWVTFVGATVIAAGLGWLSWHFVERPMLLLKRRPTVRLPPP